jgi:hypothetical protein
METLKRGASGPDVRHLQQVLAALHFRVTADGFYGPRTETAVRDFQRAQGLLPDGIAGPRTDARLAAPPAATPQPAPSQGPLTDLPQRLGPDIVPPGIKAKHVPAPPGTKQPCSQLHASDDGLAFLYAEEVDRHSNIVTWAGGASGVTLGVGYDMKSLSASQIEADMRAIGLTPTDAKTMGGAAGLSDAGGTAVAFCKQHPSWPNISKAQQVALLRRVIPSYEARVHRICHGELWQYQFDALVSVAYNPAYSMTTLGHLIDAGKYADAAADIKRRIGRKKDVQRGLINRRAKEVALFLYGDYGTLPSLA